MNLGNINPRFYCFKVPIGALALACKTTQKPETYFSFGFSIFLFDLGLPKRDSVLNPALGNGALA